MLCKECGTNLPDGSKFCLECGKITIDTPVRTVAAVAQPRSNLRRASWLLLLIPLPAIWWAATSTDPGPQAFQTLVALSHTQEIAEKAFPVNSHSFVSCKFTVPYGTTDVAVNGEFSATGNPENNVQVYVFTDDAFVTWRSGYSASTFYDSGRVPQGNINSTLPAGAGSYYLVFDNRFSQRAAKTIHADVTVHYKKWLPDWILYLRDKIWNLISGDW